MDIDGLCYETRQIPSALGRVHDDERNFELFVTKDSEYVEVHRFVEGVAYRPIIFRVGDEFEDQYLTVNGRYAGHDGGTRIRIDEIIHCPAVVADIKLNRVLKRGDEAYLTLSIFSVMNYLRDERWRKIV